MYNLHCVESVYYIYINIYIVFFSGFISKFQVAYHLWSWFRHNVYVVGSCSSDAFLESLKIFLIRVCYFLVVLARSDKYAMNRKAMINKNNETMSMGRFDWKKIK